MIRSMLKQLVSPDYPTLPIDKSWSIAASALLTILNSGRHDTLSSSPRFPSKFWQMALKQWWGIENREDAIDQIQELTTQGHRVRMAEELGHEPLAWDLCRAINIVRWCYGSKYFSEAESWNMMIDLARPLQQHYQSWTEMGVDYVAGHDQWKGDSCSDLNDAFTQLTDPKNENSPWNTIPWNTDLSQNLSQ